MKLYCFECQDEDWGTENGVALAENKQQAWKLFFKKYNRSGGYYEGDMSDLKGHYQIEKILPVNKPGAWCGYCTN